MDCNKTPTQFVDCCTVMDCIDIHSSDNTIEVTKNQCGVDLTFNGNNLDKVLKINDGECISFVKEFIDGVLTFTPVLDFDCIVNKISADICSTCQPPSPASCPAITSFVVTIQ